MNDHIVPGRELSVTTSQKEKSKYSEEEKRKDSGIITSSNFNSVASHSRLQPWQQGNTIWTQARTKIRGRILGIDEAQSQEMLCRGCPYILVDSSRTINSLDFLNEDDIGHFTLKEHGNTYYDQIAGP
ncbi:hypothetical protein DPMN_186121 [Dreissena polymorpha]|uniref:Uncharacterized protein n=1 Tax=Dreissena polymorpha TaxID=45954 RepID=A0A9D4I693_DREPO|nr:hypothetical protein DPMN_186121 [Dreissena polymorpha]